MVRGVRRAAQHGRGRAPRQPAPCRRQHPNSQPDLQELARDWITLWQSELAALAADREAQESWQAMMSLWAGAAAAMLNAMPRAAPRPSRSSGAGAA